MVLGKKMEQELNFGRWVREKRLQHGLTLPALVQRTGLDLGTISRIENEQTQATLSTAIRICDGLGESLESLVQALQGRTVQGFEVDIGSPKPNYGINVLTPYDVRAFLHFFHDERQKGLESLASLLDDIVDRLLSGNRGNRELKILRLDSEGVDTLIAASPLYSLELKYPRGITARAIQEIYARGGEIIPVDIEIYLDNIVANLFREHKDHLSEILGHVSNILTRVRIASVERVKLVDVLLIDEGLTREGLTREGEFLGIYTRVIRFNNEFGAPSENKLASTLVTASRWLQFLDWENAALPDELRKKIMEYIEL